MADEAVNRLGAMLEELGARFDLVIEAVSGFGGRLDALRDEIFGQFAEVGGQVRFLSEQIAENRKGILATHTDLGAEVIRLGETLGRARVELRDELGAAQAALRSDFAAHTALLGEKTTKAVTSSGDRLGKQSAVSREELGREIAETAKTVKREIAAAAELTARKLGAEIKQTNKSLANLARKFERFDDRITVQTRDQDQRLRKIERKG